MELEIRASERVALVGKTGSGKTTLALYLTKSLSRLVVFDPKGTLWVPEWRLEDWSKEGLQRLAEGESVRLRIPAPLNNNWEPYFTEIFSIGNCVVYIDEVYGIVPPGAKPGAMFTAMYTRGRELNIGVIAATQRPTWVPLFVLSEAEWLFVFRLQLQADRNRMAEIGGPELQEPIPAIDEYGFYVYNSLWNEPIYLRGLSIPKRRKRSA